MGTMLSHNSLHNTWPNLWFPAFTHALKLHYSIIIILEIHACNDLDLLQVSLSLSHKGHLYNQNKQRPKAWAYFSRGLLQIDYLYESFATYLGRGLFSLV
jgi:hypothetical protein